MILGDPLLEEVESLQIRLGIRLEVILSGRMRLENQILIMMTFSAPLRSKKKSQLPLDPESRTFLLLVVFPIRALPQNKTRLANLN